jgi:hypothetical protein
MVVHLRNWSTVLKIPITYIVSKPVRLLAAPGITLSPCTSFKHKDQAGAVHGVNARR